MSVLHYDPFREVDRLAEELMRGPSRGVSRSLPMDAYRRGDRFYVHLDLPGVQGDSIELTCEQNVLTVEAERRWERQEDDQVVVAERPEGRFRRQLFLSDALDAERVEADYEDGVLTITIPVAEQAKPRRIEVTASDRGPQTIEGSGERRE